MASLAQVLTGGLELADAPGRAGASALLGRDQGMMHGLLAAALPTMATLGLGAAAGAPLFRKLLQKVSARRAANAGAFDIGDLVEQAARLPIVQEAAEDPVAAFLRHPGARSFAADWMEQSRQLPPRMEGALTEALEKPAQYRAGLDLALSDDVLPVRSGTGATAAAAPFGDPPADVFYPHYKLSQALGKRVGWHQLPEPMAAAALSTGQSPQRMLDTLAAHEGSHMATMSGYSLRNDVQDFIDRQAARMEAKGYPFSDPDVSRSLWARPPGWILGGRRFLSPDYLAYLRHPDETYARIMELRHLLGATPEKIIRELPEEAANTKTLRNLLVGYDKPTILNLLNKLPAVGAGAGGLAAALARGRSEA